ncbi:MAG: hypothetical protein WBA12_07885 [Catalinimonas sp.]
MAVVSRLLNHRSITTTERTGPPGGYAVLREQTLAEALDKWEEKAGRAVSSGADGTR